MKQEINPKDTNRAIAFELWTKSPMPMVTLTKTFDVTRLCKVSHRRGMKFNMLLSWCIGKAASGIEEFYMLPNNGKLYKYDRMAINMIVENVKGGLSFCDVAVSDDLEQFNANYLRLTETIRQTCQDYTNPFLAWGRYRKHWFKVTLPISFQFHHAQMDGSHAARFLEELQKTINTI